MYYKLKLLLKSCSFFSTIHIFSRTYDYVDSMKISLQSKPRYSCKLYSYRKRCVQVFVLNTNVLTKKAVLWKGKTVNFSSNQPFLTISSACGNTKIALKWFNDSSWWFKVS